jgi:hypothetical protein
VAVRHLGPGGLCLTRLFLLRVHLG